MEDEVSNEEAARRIELIARAVRYGLDLEFRNPVGGVWHNSTGTVFDVYNFVYRIKRKPLEYYIVANEHSDGSVCSVDGLLHSKARAEFIQNEDIGTFVIKLREVQE